MVSAVIILVVGALFMARFLGGSEDAWICVNGQWVEHGHPSAPQPSSGCGNPASVGVNDPKNATYLIENQPVALAGGRAETEIAPGSASKLVTQYFGNEATGDLNGDGVPDVAFILTQSGGGSGIFYYVAVALGLSGGGYHGTDAVFLGDRIAPQSTEIKNGVLTVNYADRKPTDPMTAAPSVGISKYLKVVDGQLVEMQ